MTFASSRSSSCGAQGAVGDRSAATRSANSPAVDPSSATIRSSFLPIPCKTLSPSPLPCYPLPCTSKPTRARPSPNRTWPPSRSAFPNLQTFQRSNVPTIFDLTPSKFPHLSSLLSRQHNAPVNPLAATLMKRPASVANKRLTVKLTPLDATLTKNRGWGPSPHATPQTPAYSYPDST
jgi:hypothetical protein